MADRLEGGALRYAAGGCTFVISRLRPGALHVAIHGDDHGELGGAVFAELEREHERFAVPLELWVDTRRAAAPGGPVRDAWADWFRRRRAQLGGVHMLVRDAVLGLTGRVVRQLSSTEGIFHVSADTAAFEASLEGIAPGLAARVGADRTGDPAVRIERRESPGVVHLSDGACAYEYRRPTPAVLRLDIHGHDAGRLGAQALDELMEQQRAQVRTGSLFVDASDAGSVDARVRDEWVAWIKAHRDDFVTMSILAGSRLMQLTFGLAREAAQAGQRMRIYTDAGAFEADLKRHVGPRS